MYIPVKNTFKYMKIKQKIKMNLNDLTILSFPTLNTWKDTQIYITPEPTGKRKGEKIGIKLANDKRKICLIKEIRHMTLDELPKKLLESSNWLDKHLLEKYSIEEILQMKCKTYEPEDKLEILLLKTVR